MPEFHGKVSGVSGAFIHGWVYQTEDLLQRVVVQLCCDGQPIDVAIAQLFVRELQNQAAGDAHYGFAFRLPPGMQKWGRYFSVVVANTGQVLEPVVDMQSTAQIQQARQHEPIEAFSKVYSLAGMKLKGWAWNPKQPERQLKLSVLVDGNEIAEIVANRYFSNFPEEVASYGFEYVLPACFADGREHDVRLLDEHGRELQGSPLTMVERLVSLPQLLANSYDDEAAQQLLMELLDQYQWDWPRVVAMVDYTHWYAAFGRLSSCPQAADVSLGFLVLGQADSMALARSRATLQQQDYLHWRLLDPTQDVTASLAEVDYVCVMQGGDELTEHALGWVANALEEQQPGLLYTDSDHKSVSGKPVEPLLRSAWNYEYFCSYNYIGAVSFIRSDVFSAILSGLSFTTLTYQAVAHCLQSDLPIVHLDKIIFRHPQANSATKNSKRTVEQKQALDSFLKQVEPVAQAVERSGFPGVFQIQRPLAERPLVSLIIPTRNQGQLLSTCVDSVLNKSTYRQFEIIVVDNQSLEAETLDCFRLLQQQGVRILSYDKPFNYSAINNFAVEQARGSVIGLLNNDVEVISPDWLEEMLGLLLRPGIGAVGAKLLWPNNMVQHGGVVLGEHGLAGHLGNHLRDEDSGYMYRNQVTQQLSAVTAACLLVRKQHYLAVGGLNEFAFPVAFNDVDLCLKLQAKGLRNIWSAHARLQHVESVSRGADDNTAKAERALRERRVLRRFWGKQLVNDPHVPAALDGSLENLLMLASAQTPPFESFSLALKTPHPNPSPQGRGAMSDQDLNQGEGLKAGVYTKRISIR